MEEKLLKTIIDNNLIKKGDRVGVGLSGGSDSMTLISVLLNLQTKIGFELVAIHVNHNLRGEEALRDEKFVDSFCKKNNIKCIIKSVDVKNNAKNKKFTIEQSARELRYKAFEDIIKSEDLDVVALAHHQNDQAETILMHIGRGCGINGLVGMKYKSGKFIRPMLDVQKCEIESYLSENKIDFVEDSTNGVDDYKRNYVRHNLLKTFEKTYSGAVVNLVKLSKFASIDEDFIQSVLPQNLVQRREDGVLLLTDAKNYHLAIISRLIRKCLIELNAIVDVESFHIASILDLFDLQVGKRLDMPNGVIAVKCYEGVLFKKKTIERQENVAFGLGDFSFCGKKYRIELVKDGEIKKDKGLYFDLDKIPANAEWRNYLSDDIFTKFGGGSKKVKDYLVSKKVDSERRKTLPCLCCENVCLLIAGVEISEKIKVDQETKNVGVLYKI